MNIKSIVLIIILSFFFPLSSGSVENYPQFGNASWYGEKFHGRKTANGERFNKYGFTGAHKKLPFGTIIRVTNSIKKFIFESMIEVRLQKDE